MRLSKRRPLPQQPRPPGGERVRRPAAAQCPWQRRQVLGLQPPPPADGQRRVMVLDALDECESNGKNALLDLIARRFGKAGALPGWLRLVVTSRPEGDIIAKLAAFEPLAMECDGNDADARLYLAHLLRGKVAAADEAAAV